MEHHHAVVEVLKAKRSEKRSVDETGKIPPKGLGLKGYRPPKEIHTAFHGEPEENSVSFRTDKCRYQEINLRFREKKLLHEKKTSKTSMRR